MLNERLILNKYWDLFRNFDEKSRNIYWVKEDKENNKTTLIYAVPGLSSEDISVGLEYNREYDNDVLVVRGEKINEVTGVKHPGNIMFFIGFSVDKIKWKTKDGLLYIDLFYRDSGKDIEIICEE